MPSISFPSALERMGTRGCPRAWAGLGKHLSEPVSIACLVETHACRPDQNLEVMGDRDLKEIKKHPLPAARLRGDRWTVLAGAEANPELWELTGRRASWTRWLGPEVVQGGFLEEVAWRRGGSRGRPRSDESTAQKGGLGASRDLTTAVEGSGQRAGRVQGVRPAGRGVYSKPQCCRMYWRWWRGECHGLALEP